MREPHESLKSQLDLHSDEFWFFNRLYVDISPNCFDTFCAGKEAFPWAILLWVLFSTTHFKDKSVLQYRRGT